MYLDSSFITWVLLDSPVLVVFDMIDPADFFAKPYNVSLCNVRCNHGHLSYLG